MELSDLDRLVEKYTRQGYQQIRVKAGDLEIEVTKPSDNSNEEVRLTATTSQESATADDLETITSPMVGVVHLAQGLEAGQLITKGQELGQIESMKLFNPLTSPVDGTLATVLVTDNATVEYEQPLFEMRRDR